MKKLIFALVVALVAGCTAPKKATRLLESQGYTDVEITGYKFWGCSEDDRFHTGFRAKGVTGREVSGVVCSGLIFKGATVRFD